MDADNSGDIDLDEWTNCMTKELRIAIYRQLNNKDKLAGFKPLVDVAKVQQLNNLLFFEKLRKVIQAGSMYLQCLNNLLI